MLIVLLFYSVISISGRKRYGDDTKHQKHKTGKKTGRFSLSYKETQLIVFINKLFLESEIYFNNIMSSEQPIINESILISTKISL